MLGLQFFIPAVLFASHYEGFKEGYDQVCTHRDNENGKLMLVAVFVYYIIKVVPEQVSSFYVRVVGAGISNMRTKSSN